MKANLEDSSFQTSPSLRPGMRTTILYGGLAAGVGDGLFALIFYGAILGVPSLRIFQSVAAGLLGSAAFQGGEATFTLGVLLHFVVATCIAAVFYLLSSQLPALLQRPVFCGLSYGAGAYLVMKYVVIPLSAVPARRSGFHLSSFVTEMIGHAFLVGLPIALIGRYSADARSDKLLDERIPDQS